MYEKHLPDAIHTAEDGFMQQLTPLPSNRVRITLQVNHECESGKDRSGKSSPVFQPVDKDSGTYGITRQWATFSYNVNVSGGDFITSCVCCNVITTGPCFNRKCDHANVLFYKATLQC